MYSVDTVLFIKDNNLKEQFFVNIQHRKELKEFSSSAGSFEVCPIWGFGASDTLTLDGLVIAG